MIAWKLFHRKRRRIALAICFSLHFLSGEASDTNASTGVNIINEFCTKESIDCILFSCSKRFYLLAAMSELFNHIEIKSSEGFRPNSINFKVASCKGNMLIGIHPLFIYGLVAAIVILFRLLLS